jgi:hypothetical protein
VKEIIPQEKIENKIIFLRGLNVIMDRDIAELYGVKPIALRQQVKRNIERFPEDFMLKLTEDEADFLVSQNVIPSKRSLGGYLPYAFTEQGVAMLSSVLKSQRAIYVNIQIMRTFTKLRQILSTHKELRRKIEEMEKKYDHQFKVVFDVINKLLEPKENKPKRIGFKKD